MGLFCRTRVCRGCLTLAEVSSSSVSCTRCCLATLSDLSVFPVPYTRCWQGGNRTRCSFPARTYQMSKQWKKRGFYMRTDGHSHQQGR